MSPSLLSGWFVLGLLIVVVLRAISPPRLQPAVILAGGPILIALASFETFLLLGGTSVLVLFPLAAGMRAMRRRGHDQTATRWLLFGGVALILMVWVAYKVSRDYELPVLGTTYTAKLAAAFGFSYFIFRGISYLYMHHLVDLPERTPLAALGYSLFPSTVTRGPIHQYRDFKRDSEHPIPASASLFGTAVFRITQGYFYKVCLAEWLQNLANPLLAAEHPVALESLAVIVLLYVIFYFDFAGYSHIAIGFGLLLGIRVPENFRMPFLATTVTEFWRNWHISIADWFRNHVFIPAGGMRSSRPRAGILALLVMVICGLWHGFTPLFLAWGILHGSLLLTEAVWGTTPLPRAKRHGFPYWRRVLATNAKVAFAGLLFLPSFDAIGKLLGGFLRWS